AVLASSPRRASRSARASGSNMTNRPSPTSLAGRTSRTPIGPRGVEQDPLVSDTALALVALLPRRDGTHDAVRRRDAERPEVVEVLRRRDVFSSVAGTGDADDGERDDGNCRQDIAFPHRISLSLSLSLSLSHRSVLMSTLISANSEALRLPNKAGK